MTTPPDDLLAPILEECVDITVSYALQSGYFDRVQAHEPKSGPRTGLTFACWVQDITPVAARSGLSKTSARFNLQSRVFLNMLREPADLIDINLTKAVSYMMAMFTMHFDPEGAYVDLLGAHSAGLTSQAGYVDMDGKMFRIMDTIVPFVADDVWAQGGAA